jgi:intein/homing endonuclease
MLILSEGTVMQPHNEQNNELNNFSTKVRKRDGVTFQDYDIFKIKKAIVRAWNDTNVVVDDKSLNKIIKTIYETTKMDVIDVETIQDIVETSLMRHGQFEVAKSYILYRHKRSEARQARKASPDSKAISDYIHASKYARYLPELGRREVFEETVSRVELMHFRKFPSLAEDIKGAFDLVRQKKVLPSMRSMQFGGAAIEANNARIFNCSFSFIDRVEVFSEALFLLLSGCGVGYSVQHDHVEKLPSIPYIDPKKVRHFVVEDTIEGWADSLKALIQSYLDGLYLEISYHKIRSAGAPLVTSGGRAPGHLKLKEPLERIRSILSSAQGRKLRPIECHRIMCHAADAVLAGGIRRSAMICLFSLDDSEMMNCKTGNWWQNDPWFANANNSVVLKRDEVKKKQFKRIFQMTRQWGEPGFYFTHDYDYGTNPCFHPDTIISTTEGLVRIADLCAEYEGKEGLKILAQTPDGPQVKNATVFKTGTKNVVEVHTRRGRVIKVTPDHRLMTTEGWVEAQDLNEDSVLCLQAGPGTNDTKSSGLDIMWYKLAGWMVGDGWVSSPRAGRPDRNNYQIGLCFGKDDGLALGLTEAFLKSQDIGYSVAQYPGSVGDPPNTIRIERKGVWEILTNLGSDPGSKAHNKYVKDSILRGSSEEQLAFLAGYFSADGTLNIQPKNNLDARFSSTSLELLQGVQSLLLNFGVNSSIYKDRRVNQKPTSFKYTTSSGEERTYSSKHIQNELVITGASLRTFKNLMLKTGLMSRSKSDKLESIGDIINNAGRDRWTDEVVRVVDNGEVVDVYDITEPDTHSLIANGIVAHNCCEIGLNPKLVIDEKVQSDLLHRGIDVKVGSVYSGWAFCNLCEINAAKLTSYEDFVEVAKAATLIGTIQATYTKLPYLGWVSEYIAERESLLGIGMTGMLDTPNISCNPEYQKDIAEKIKTWNAEYAKILGVKPAARTTCIKPSGTTSLELGCVGSGHHAHHARRYIRRVTADELENIFQAFKSVNPHMCVRKPDGKYVIEFPVEAPSGAIIKEDLGAIQFLEMVKSTQQNWVVPGTADESISPGLNHNVSNTVNVKPDEWDKVSDYLWENRNYFTGVSLLSATGDKDYAFAPMEAVVTEADESRWNAILNGYKPVDYTSILEIDDDTNLSAEAACAGGACMIN